MTECLHIKDHIHQPVSTTYRIELSALSRAAEVKVEQLTIAKTWNSGIQPCLVPGGTVLKRNGPEEADQRCRNCTAVRSRRS